MEYAIKLLHEEYKSCKWSIKAIERKLLDKPDDAYYVKMLGKITSNKNEIEQVIKLIKENV